MLKGLRKAVGIRCVGIGGVVRRTAFCLGQFEALNARKVEVEQRTGRFLVVRHLNERRRMSGTGQLKVVESGEEKNQKE